MKRVFLIFFFIPVLIRAQTISGFIKDSTTNTPLVGVNITIGDKGTTSNENGYFEFSNIASGKYLVKFSFVGFQPQEKWLFTSDKATPYIILLSKDDIYLDEVVIASTRTENRISQVPGRVNMINAERISMIATQSIDEKLQFLPGVQVSRSFGIFSTKSSVTMRGLSGNEQARTLVLLDGVPVNKADGGSVNWNLISTSEIERVEVVKGPGSALYGGNAMGGIINIITSKPTSKIQGNLNLSYGTYNTKDLKLNLGGKFNNDGSKGFYWGFNTYYCLSDGYITQSKADQKANPFIVKSNVNERAFNFRTGYFNAKKLSGVIDISLYDGIRGTGEKVYQPNGNQTEYFTYQIRASVNGLFQKINYNASFFFLNENYKKVNEWYKDDYTWYNVASVRRDFGLLTGANYTLKNHSFTAGFDVRNGQVDASDIYYTSTDQVDNNGKMSFLGLYFQDEVTLLQYFKVLLGLRYDFARYYDGSFIIFHPSAETTFLNQYQFSGLNDETWGALSPRISLQYRPTENLRIYGGYSRGFRPSVLDDLCRTGRVKGGMKVANPNLRPEYLHNFELGGDIVLIKGLKLSGSTYLSKGSDFLYYVSTGDSIDMGFGERPIMIRSNISKTEIIGAEFDFNYSITPKISVFGNYAYANAKIVEYKPLYSSDPVNLDGKYLTDVPKHSFAAGAFLKSNYINAGLTCKYSGSMYVNDQNIFDEIVLSNQYPAWITFDLNISIVFFKHFSPTVKIQNILDKHIYDSKGAVGPGRFITFSITAKI